MANQEDRGMLFVLNDVEPAHEEEFNRWYDTEHMQERMAVPGFLSVRRYRVRGAGLRYCTLYSTESLAVFGSEAYRQKLAAQSEWSKRILTVFVEPNRLVGEVRATFGDGFAGHLAVLKLSGSRGDNTYADHAIGSCLAELPGIAKVRLFEAEPRLSGPVKEYRPVLRPLVKPDDRLLLVEARDAEALEPGRLESAGRGSTGSFVHLGTYSFSWGLASAPI